MEEKYLYLKRKDDGFEFDLQPFYVEVMNDDVFLFKEAAVVILYPDGSMDAVRAGEGMHHNYYYDQLYGRSKRFKEAVDLLGYELDFKPDESTYELDCLLSSLGISSIHNVNIHNIPFRLEQLENFEPIFYTFKAENTTSEVDKNFDVIYENCPSECIVKNQYSSESGRFERENKEEIRKM